MASPLFSAVLAISFAVAMGASRAAPTVGFAATKVLEAARSIIH